MAWLKAIENKGLQSGLIRSDACRRALWGCRHCQGSTRVNFFTKTRYTCVALAGRREADSMLSRGGLAVRSRQVAMAKRTRRFSYVRSARFLQDNATRSGAVASASYTLVGGIILLGAMGYGFDRWRDTAPWGLVVGLALGIVVGFYELVKAAWRQ